MSKLIQRVVQGVLSVGFVIGMASVAHAQATRTWVSGVGDDANPCSRTAPCKTFAGAISKTADGGYINALDSGGFGAVTITKGITIDGGGVLAGVLASLTNGIIVNAANKMVTLRNLSIESPSANAGINGIHVLAAREVHIEKVVITGFSNNAINFVPSAGAEGYVSDVTLVNNAAGGLFVQFGRVAVTNLHAESNGNGAAVNGTAVMTIRDSIASGGPAGFVSATAGGLLNLENCVTTHNTNGIQVNGGATARISNTLIANNVTTGILNDGLSFAVSLQGNQVVGNPGVFTSTTLKQ